MAMTSALPIRIVHSMIVRLALRPLADDFGGRSPASGRARASVVSTPSDSRGGAVVLMPPGSGSVTCAPRPPSSHATASREVAAPEPGRRLAADRPQLVRRDHAGRGSDAQQQSLEPRPFTDGKDDAPRAVRALLDLLGRV